MNFSIIKTGGKQYLAEKGAKLRIEIIKGDYKESDIITFDKVLFVAKDGQYQVGAPLISGATVQAKILSITRDDTIRIVKYRAKSRYHKANGHRQPRFVVEIL
jgi:large subunit ribosomal protein L21